MSAPLPAQVLSYEFEVSIQAPRSKVWKALTEETNAWWLPDFHMVGTESTVTFDARAGGHLVGHLAPPYGGPATTMLELALNEEDGTTKLIIRDALYGNVSEKTAGSLESGWRQLFGDGLGAYAEKA